MGAEPVRPDDESRPVARVPWLASWWRSVRRVFRRETLGKDAVAGTVLGIEAVPDALAIGLLAGVNPVAGIYAFMFGMAGAALATSSTFMAVQATSAMALIVSDTDLSTQPDPDRALYTLAMLTGVIMIVAGALGAGRMLRFVPTAVMVGFVTAVGVNIVLGQLANLTGYVGVGPNRLFKAVDTFANIWSFDLPTLVVGLVTIALIVVLTRTPLRSLGLVVAIAVGSALAALFTFAFGWAGADRRRCRRRAERASRAGAPEHRRPGLPRAARALARVRRPRAGRRGGGRRAERRRPAGRRQPELHRPGCRQHHRRGLPGNAGRRLDVGLGADRRRGRPHPPRTVHRGDGDGAA